MRRYLTEPEQRDLLKAAKSDSDPLAQRDFHWMSVLILTGMRIQEFTLLTAELARLALRSGWLVSLKKHCKGKKRANEYLVTHQLRVHLQALLDLSDKHAAALAIGAADPQQLQPLVWGREIRGKAGPLSVRSYEARMKIWAAKAALDHRVSPHWLRHTRGMNIMRRSRGKDAIRVAKLALNHASIRSTGIYTQMSREEFESEIHLVDGGRVPRRVARDLAERAVQ